MSDEPSTISAEEIAVFQAYVDLINSERETIWARHNALLVANSLIVGALALSAANRWADLALIAAGLFISAAWFMIALQGWAAEHRHAEIAGSFTASCFKHLPNPFSDGVYGRTHTAIHRLILFVIAVFALMYLGLGFIRLGLL